MTLAVVLNAILATILLTALCGLLWRVGWKDAVDERSPGFSRTRDPKPAT